MHKLTIARVPKTKSQKETLKESYDIVVAKKNFIVVEISKVPANAFSQLRKELSKVEGSFTILKNRVFLRSLKSTTEDVIMEGPLAVLEGGSDIVTALKAFDAVTKEVKSNMAIKGVDDRILSAYSPFSYKFGVINESILGPEDVVRLSKLPDRQTVIAQFIGTMAAPLSSTMNVMNGVIRNLVYVLTDLQNKKA